MRILRQFAVIVCFGMTCLIGNVTAFSDEPLVERFLKTGELKRGERELKRYLATNPEDDRVRFELGILQFVQTVEHLGQSLYDYGVTDEIRQLPFIRLPVPFNPDPKPVSYSDMREIFETVVRDLNRADATLARVKDPKIKLPLHIFQYYLDWNQNDEIEDNESLNNVFERYLGRDFNQTDAVVIFDSSDVHWFRGYCSLLRSMCEFLLAYDQKAVWDVVAHRVFPKAKVKYDFLLEENDNNGIWLQVDSLRDIVAGIHNLNMPLVDGQRVENARVHLLGMIEQSRLMWDKIEKETDNDNEWIPNVKQKSAVTNFRVTVEMIATWRMFLRESEQVLNGELLIPFWRGKKSRGVNLKKFCSHPRNFDLVMWIHGSAAVPYLEEADKEKFTQPETWQRFQEVFGGDFYGFAAWVN